MGVGTWIVLDAADAAATAEDCSIATTVDKSLPPPVPSASSRRRRSPTHILPSPPRPSGPPLPPHPSHSPPIPHHHTPRGRSCTPGFPGDRFSSLGGTGGLHPRYTRPYIHSAHHSRPPYTPPTRPPPMSGSPQAETGTSDHRQGRRRRHRRRHDGAVAHLAQLPAAAPRCRDLPDSSLADRAGREPSRHRCREGRGLSAGPGPFMLGLLIIPPPPLFPTYPNFTPSPPLPLITLPHARTHTPHSRHALTHTHQHTTLPTRPHTHTHNRARPPSCLTTRGSSYYARSGITASHIELRPVPTP
jgi:hypothetical protein